MNQTVYDKGIEKGIEKGRREGRVELVLSLLDERFGPLNKSLREALLRQIEDMPLDQLSRLTLKIAAAASLAEVGLSTTV